MKLYKRVLRSNVVEIAICGICAAYLRAVYLTGAWSVQKDPEFERIWDSGKPFILCFWHGRLLMMPFAWSRQRIIHMLMSASWDGQLVTRMVRQFGIRAVTGSRNHGRIAAFRSMMNVVRRGEWVGITPDGSRGPHMRVSDGCINLARVAQVPLVPLTFSCSRGKVLKTWDRQLVPWPFCRGTFIWGAPIMVPRTADQTARERLEKTLNDITEEADRLMGRTPIRPSVRSGTDDFRPASGTKLSRESRS